MENIKNVHILDHPLIRHKLAIIRNKNTDTKMFREIIGIIEEIQRLFLLRGKFPRWSQQLPALQGSKA